MCRAKLQIAIICFDTCSVTELLSVFNSTVALRCCSLTVYLSLPLQLRLTRFHYMAGLPKQTGHYTTMMQALTTLTRDTVTEQTAFRSDNLSLDTWVASLTTPWKRAKQTRNALIFRLKYLSMELFVITRRRGRYVKSISQPLEREARCFPCGIGSSGSFAKTSRGGEREQDS